MSVAAHTLPSYTAVKIADMTKPDTVLMIAGPL